MKLKLSPAPSPAGTNIERLFLLRLGGKGPVGAYDEAPEGELRARLEELLAENLSGSAYASSIDTLNNLLPPGLGAHEANDEDDEDDEDDDTAAVTRIIDFIREKLGGDRARAADLDVAKALVRDEFRQRKLSRDRARRLSRDRARRRGRARHARDMEEALPRSGVAGGFGGRLSEDRRRRMASDAQSDASAVFDLFPELRRIGVAGGHR